MFEKGGLTEASLAKPGVSFAGDQAIAEYGLIRPRTKMLDVIFRIGHQHLLDQVGVRDQEDSPRSKSQTDHFAVLLDDLHKEIESPLSELTKVSSDPCPFRSGW